MLAAHAGICAGGAGRPASRPQTPGTTSVAPAALALGSVAVIELQRPSLFHKANDVIGPETADNFSTLAGANPQRETAQMH